MARQGEPGRIGGLLLSQRLGSQGQEQSWFSMESLLILGVFLAVLVLAVSVVDVHPFIALLVTGVLLGLALGMPLADVLDSLLTGFAEILKWIGIVMVLGTVIGEILNETGGSIQISNSIFKLVGKERLPMTMATTGYVVAIPVFVDVAYIMLQPVTESLAARSKHNILVVGLSLAAGLTVAHALIPPTPGPLASAGLLDANLGKVILLNVFVAFFSAAGGLLWATQYCKRRDLPYDKKLQRRLEAGELQTYTEAATPNAVSCFAPIFVPLSLIAAASFVQEDSQRFADRILAFLGTPTVALFAGIIIASLLLKHRGRMGRLRELVDRSIEKAAVVIMITGAGGALGGVIKASAIGDNVASAIMGVGIPGLLLPFLLAAALTTATGSLTVSVVTSSSIIAPMLDTLPFSPAMGVALIGAGSLCFIHVNSSFFWLLSRLHEVPPSEVYRTFSVQSACMGLGGLVGILLLWSVGIT